MKFIVLLMLALLMFTSMGQEEADATADADATEEETGGATVEEVEFVDSKQLMRDIQGIEEDTVWIIQFHDNDEEDGLKDTIEAGLKEDPYTDHSGDVIYEDLSYKLASIDINNSKFDAAREALGMTSNQFQATYPVALVMRKRKGLFAWGWDLGQSVLERMWEVADGNIDPYA